MADSALTVTGLTKRFGTTTALDGLSFSLREGSTCALVGPNGAGKTTIIAILLGLLDADSGSARIFGHEAGSMAARHSIGYLPDVPSFPGWMKADEVLSLAMDLSGTGDRSSARALLEAVGLAGNNRPVRMFSRGMRQRLGLAQALVCAPRLLILDEPTSALDPAGRHLFHGLVDSLKGRATVLYSTHSLNEAERVCDSAVIVDRGHLIRHDSMDDLITDGQGIVLEVVGDAGELVGVLERADWVTGVRADRDGSRSRVMVTVADMGVARDEISALLSRTGTALHSLRPRTLEEIFLDLTGGSS